MPWHRHRFRAGNAAVYSEIHPVLLKPVRRLPLRGNAQLRGAEMVPGIERTDLQVVAGRQVLDRKGRRRAIIQRQAPWGPSSGDRPEPSRWQAPGALPALSQPSMAAVAVLDEDLDRRNPLLSAPHLIVPTVTLLPVPGRPMRLPPLPVLPSRCHAPFSGADSRAR